MEEVDCGGERICCGEGKAGQKRARLDCSSFRFTGFVSTEFAPAIMNAETSSARALLSGDNKRSDVVSRRSDDKGSRLILSLELTL